MIFPENLWADGVLGDAYADKTTYTPTISGGVAFGGDTTVTPIIGQYTFIGIGGIDFSGDALTNQAYEPFISGGIDFAGDADLAVTVNISADGDISFTGNADIVRSNNIVSSGTVNFSPAHVLSVIRNVLQAGTVLFSGETDTEQTIEYTYSPLITGEVVFDGSDNTAFIPTAVSTFSTVGSGGFALSGASDIIRVINILGTGSVTFTGKDTTDNPTDHQQTEIVTFNLTINREDEFSVVIDREFETNVQITRSVDITNVL